MGTVAFNRLCVPAEIASLYAEAPQPAKHKSFKMSGISFRDPFKSGKKEEEEDELLREQEQAMAVSPAETAQNCKQSSLCLCLCLCLCLTVYLSVCLSPFLCVCDAQPMRDEAVLSPRSLFLVRMSGFKTQPFRSSIQGEHRTRGGVQGAWHRQLIHTRGIPVRGISWAR